MDQVEEIKNKLDIVSFINEYVPLKKAGRNFKALCPFHDEKTPSFVVSGERQIWRCFGCGEGGDIFSFLMKFENVEFFEALQILAEKAGIKLVKKHQGTTSSLKPKIYEINHLASEFYHYLLLSNKYGKRALDYLTSRGISKKIIRTFRLGYAPRSWESTTRFLQKKGYSLEELEKSGLIIHTKGKKAYDRFRGRVIFTLFNHRGDIVGFAGRVINEDKNRAKYINTPETPVYSKGNTLYGLNITKTAIKEADQAILVEGEFDVLSSYQAGIGNVVAIKGSALTENQARLLSRFTQNLAFALDADIAGDKAARRGVEIADNFGFNIKVINLFGGKDPDECIRNNPAYWKKAVKETVGVYDFLLQSARERFSKGTVEDKRSIAEEFLPILTKVTNPIIQAHYTRKLSGVIDLAEEAVVKALEKMTQKSKRLERTVSKKPKVVVQQDREEKLSRYLLALFLQSECARTIPIDTRKREIFAGIKHSGLKEVLNLLINYLEKNKSKKFRIDEFVSLIPKELTDIVDEACLLDLNVILGVDDRQILHEVEKALRQLEKIVLQRKISLLSTEIEEEEEKEGDTDKLKDTLRELASRLREP